VADAASPAPTPTDDPAPPERHIRSFALRRGHVTLGQKRAFESIFPAVAVAPDLAPIDPPALFGRHAPLVLEIGFGMGETTAAIAQALPDVDFLCVEVFVAGIGALCKRIDEHGLKNIRIVQGDAVELLARLPHDLLAGVHVFFPDPWPKARHHKRRLIAQPFVGRLARRIAPGGYLHCATDWDDYARQMLAELGAEPALRNAHPDASEGYAPHPVNPLATRPTTKFHARGERLGHGVWDLVFLRR